MSLWLSSQVSIMSKGVVMKYDEEKNFEETKEPRFYARELLYEILLLLKECFVAKFRVCEDGISIRFLNGQRAFLAVWFTEP